MWPMMEKPETPSSPSGRIALMSSCGVQFWTVRSNDLTVKSLTVMSRLDRHASAEGSLTMSLNMVTWEGERRTNLLAGKSGQVWTGLNPTIFKLIFSSGFLTAPTCSWATLRQGMRTEVENSSGCHSAMPLTQSGGAIDILTLRMKAAAVRRMYQIQHLWNCGGIEKNAQFWVLHKQQDSPTILHQTQSASLSSSCTWSWKFSLDTCAWKTFHLYQFLLVSPVTTLAAADCIPWTNLILTEREFCIVLFTRKMHLWHSPQI